MNSNINRELFFAYTKAEKFSGQTAASELLINIFQSEGYRCRQLVLYPLARKTKFLMISFIMVLVKQLRLVPSLCSLLFSRKSILHLNLGQSFWSFIRIGIWYFPIIFLNRQISIVVSLHGNLFMLWGEDKLKTKMFLRFLRSANTITVLGENQRNRLIGFGLKKSLIKVVPNSCSIDPISDLNIHNKHKKKSSRINILFLSLLLESKGFVIYLEALERISGFDIPQIEAILCGPLTTSPYNEQFSSIEEKRRWIEAKVARINKIHRGKVFVRWIPGASGEIKRRLFENSHIFVLPTYFPVEAQPIVLLEALASGAAIITTTAGEIPSTLNKDCSIMIEDPTSEKFAEEIFRLITNAGQREEMALAGAKLICGSLSLKKHISTWNSIFEELSNNNLNNESK